MKVHLCEIMYRWMDILDLKCKRKMQIIKISFQIAGFAFNLCEVAAALEALVRKAGFLKNPASLFYILKLE